MSLKAKVMWTMFVGAVVAGLAWVVGIPELIRRRRTDAIMLDLKAKIAAAREEREARKEETAKAIAQVEADTAKELTRDPVDVANDLIISARSGDPVIKG